MPGTFQDYKIDAEYDAVMNKDYRRGQSAFNKLSEYNPVLKEFIRGSFILDPFNSDDKLPAFYEFVNLAWGETNIVFLADLYFLWCS